MTRPLDEPWLAILGSVTRAYSLSVLAGTRVPQTAYRIAKLAGLSAPNVYLELKRLAEVGVVRRTPSGWLLEDARIRALCEGTGPLFRRRFSLDQRSRLAAGDNRPLSPPLAGVSSDRRPNREPRRLREFRRSPTKNLLLRAAGLRPSRHRGRG